MNAQDTRKPVRLSVDLREVTKRIFHAKLAFPVFRADGKEIEWRRDDVDMFEPDLLGEIIKMKAPPVATTKN